MSSVEDSPASPSVALDTDGASEMSVGDGHGWSESYAWLDPDTSSWKTSQLSLITLSDSDGCSPTFPRSGSMRSGQLYQRAPWVHHIHVIGCSWWPTPTAAMGRRGWGLGQNDKGRYKQSTIERVHGVIALTGHWRPPVLMVERLMGFPDEWLVP